ncbi:TPA: FkbM family methyltransferase [Candidatus Bathyarchaeota archaeon]|nr:FkbM family methyltransferase [Candidatus Bathyarchaeota archaeon]
MTDRDSINSPLKYMLFYVFKKIVSTFSIKGLTGNRIFNPFYTPICSLLLPSCIKVFGYKLHLNPNDSLCGAMASGIYERFEVDLFRRVVKEGDVIVDVGAHIGYYTLLAAALIGKNGKVYAFEPEPLSFSILTRNVKENNFNDRVILVKRAVSDKTAKVKLFPLNKNLRSYVTLPSGKTVDIETTTLDEFFEDKNWKVDVVKIDVDGAESLVFSGMKKIVEQNRNLKVFMEFSPIKLKRFGTEPHKFLEKIMDWGFVVWTIEDGRRSLKNVHDFDELLKACARGKRRTEVNLFLAKDFKFDGIISKF